MNNKKCNHAKAYGGWSDTEYLVYCPDCGIELDTKQVQKLAMKVINKISKNYEH